MTELESYYNQLFILFGRLNIAIMTLPVIMALVRWKYLNRPLRVFSIFIFLVLLLNLVEQLIIYVTTKYYHTFFKPYLDYWEIIDTSFFQILYYLNYLVLLALFYTLIMPKVFQNKIKIVAITLVFGIIVNYLFIEGYKVYGFFNPLIAAVWGIVLPGLYLLYLFDNMLHFPLNKNPYFWISFGLIATGIIGLFLYLAGNAMQERYLIMFFRVSIARNIFDIFGQILISLGFWYAPYAKYIPLPNSSMLNDNVKTTRTSYLGIDG